MLDLLETVLDSFKLVMYLSIGSMFGFAVGVVVGMMGLQDFITEVPSYALLIIFIIFAIGIYSLIIMFNLKIERIEKIKNEKR